MVNKYISKLLHYVLEVYVCILLITAFKCISKLTSSQPASVFISSHNIGLQVYIEVLYIMGFKCIALHTWLWPPSGSPNSLGSSLQRIFNFPQIQPLTGISNLALSQPPSSSSNSLNLGLHMHLWHIIILALRCALSSLDYSVHVNVHRDSVCCTRCSSDDIVVPSDSRSIICIYISRTRYRIFAKLQFRKPSCDCETNI